MAKGIRSFFYYIIIINGCIIVLQKNIKRKLIKSNHKVNAILWCFVMEELNFLE